MSFEKMMEELKKEYVAGLPGKINDIESNFANDDVQLVREDFHKLKGTGSTYGLPEVSLVSEAVEKICVTNPSELSSVIPAALGLLRDIHFERQASRSLEVDKDARYHLIRKIANT